MPKPINQHQYQYNLGDDLFLNAFSLDPEIQNKTIETIILSIKKSKKISHTPNSFELKKTIFSLDELKIIANTREYSLPEALIEYKNKLSEKLIAKGMFNGSIMVIDGQLNCPIQVIKGSYFDFKASNLDAIPAEIAPDFYPSDKTTKDLLSYYNIDISQLARYLGFAFIMKTDNGKEISLVQRAKGLGIAADCMALSGGTPAFSNDFFKPNFNFKEYFTSFIAEEMNEEYNLKKNEYETKSSYIIDDVSSVPFVAVEIVTPLSLKDLAERNFGRSQAIKEHPILYSINYKGLPELIQHFKMHESTSFVLDILSEKR